MARIVVIGAGPVGLEAALYGVTLGHDVQVYERGRIGDNIRSWGHVTLFSPWKINHSPLGAGVLRQSGGSVPDPESYLTGQAHVASYLEPLARSLAGRVHERTAVRHVGRERLGKAHPFGSERRRCPLRLLVEGAAGESVVTADVVLDCSGTYGHHNWMGSGGIPAVGEQRLESEIRYTLDDFSGAARRNYEGKRILLVGDGQSAATALGELRTLAGTTVLWVSRRDQDPPHRIIPDDPLPERARLSRLANDLAGGADAGVTRQVRTVVEAVERHADGFEVALASAGSVDRVAVDRILALVGYSPDNSIYRALQVHECYATFGPIDLAATLLSGDADDCLTQTSKGPDVLRNPEPDFYVVGAKSYGTNSQFLIRLGLDQIREVFTLIEGRPELNLYAA